MAPHLSTAHFIQNIEPYVMIKSYGERLNVVKYLSSTIIFVVLLL